MLADKRGEEVFEEGSSTILLDVSSDDDSLRAIDLGVYVFRLLALAAFVGSRGASQSPLLSVGEVENVEAGEPKKEDRRDDDPLRPGLLSISAVSREPAPLIFSSCGSVISGGVEVVELGPIVLARLRSRVLFNIEDVLLFCPAPCEVTGEDDNRELA